MKRILHSWLIAILIGLLLPGTPAWGDTLSIESWSTGSALSATNLNSRMTSITTWANGLISSANLKAAAGVKGSQLDLTDGTTRIVNSGGTVTSDSPAISTSQTFNNAATVFTLIRGNATCTGCASASRLLDLQIGGTIVASISRTGQLALSPQNYASGPTTLMIGAFLNIASATYTDNMTAASGTAPRFMAYAFQRPALAAANTSVTTTDAATVFIASAPVAGNNMTLTRRWALLTEEGNSRLSGAVFINGRTNANVTRGLTIHQEANDDLILALKSSDVVHGLTSAGLVLTQETDDYAVFGKRTGADGGLYIGATADGTTTTAFQLSSSIAANANTAKTTAGVGIITLFAQQHDGANGQANVVLDGNIFAIRTRSGGADVTRFIFDGEGSAHADVEWVAFDRYDDVRLLASLEREMAPFQANRPLVEADLGGSLGYSRDQLRAAGIVNFYDPAGKRAMVNFTRLSMLHSGAIRQVHAQVRGYQQRLEWALTRISQLEQRLNQRGPSNELATLLAY